MWNARGVTFRTKSGREHLTPAQRWGHWNPSAEAARTELGREVGKAARRKDVPHSGLVPIQAR